MPSVEPTDESRDCARGDVLTAERSPPLAGRLVLPGDKSISHRALILGSLARGTTIVSGLLEAEDVLHTARAVEALGATVDRLGDGHWRIEGAEWRTPSQPIDCGNSGTGARLLMGATAGFPIEVTFVGDESLSRRPMERVLEPLRRMGARTRGSTLPVSIAGGGLKGIEFLNDPASAQVKSAILLAGLNAEGTVEIDEPLPSRNHTENMFAAFSCPLEISGPTIRLKGPQHLLGTTVDVPGDPSSAAFPIVASLIVPGSELTIANMMINPSRTGLLATLREMGADIEITNERQAGGEQVADILVRSSKLLGVDVPATRAPSMIDEYPILAVAAAFASGRTVMQGLGELRVKESDRLAAIVASLRGCGVEAFAEGDTLIVEGTGGDAPGGAAIDARADHRIAMSFLVFGLASRAPVSVNSARMIGTSFPGFATTMTSTGARIS